MIVGLVVSTIVTTREVVATFPELSVTEYDTMYDPTTDVLTEDELLVAIKPEE